MPTTGEQGRVRSSPLVRKIAKENNVDLAKVPGTGLGGRITKEDIEAFIAKHAGGAPAVQPTQLPRRAAGGAQLRSSCALRPSPRRCSLSVA